MSDELLLQGTYTDAVTLTEKGACMYDNRFKQLPKRNVSMSYYLQSYKYFQHVEDQLRLDLTFKPNVLDKANRWLKERTPVKWTTKEFWRVLIHVRRKDYTRPRYSGFGWQTPTAEYFRRSTSYFIDCLEHVQFVVLSDDPAWCKKHIKAIDIVFSVGQEPIVDMAIASLCNHAIITLGSFGWWAAWFANGITITPKNTPLKGSRLAKMLRWDDYFKPEWIAL